MPAPKVPTYQVAIANLSAQIPAIVALGPQERAYFESSISEARAIEIGASVESATVLDEVLRIGSLAMAHVVAGKVVGYGPLRARYLLETCAELAAKVGVLDGALVDAAGAGVARMSSMRDARSLRRDAIRILNNLAGGREEGKERLKQVRRGAPGGRERIEERARTLDALASEIEIALASVPAGVAEDAGATPALVEALRQSATAVLAKRGEAQGARGTVAATYDAMNLLDGRVLHEVRLLVGALRDARRTDNTVPAVRSALVRNGARKPKPAAPVSGKPAASPVIAAPPSA
ncbi:Hypothetical protein A7982_05354 [Minicystis rosea]|nr:Hypothetical protein A7982_05354 [Minicystis rosea]